MTKLMSSYADTQSKILYNPVFSESYRIFASGIYVFTKIDFYEINDIENAGKYIREYMWSNENFLEHK